jgi:hypothetical protein
MLFAFLDHKVGATAFGSLGQLFYPDVGFPEHGRDGLQQVLQVWVICGFRSVPALGRSKYVFQIIVEHVKDLPWTVIQNPKVALALQITL